MENEYVSRHEHDEFVKRIESEDDRQNHRIAATEEKLEKLTDTMTNLALSVEKLSNAMTALMDSTLKNYEKKFEEQKKIISAIEGRDGEMWRKFVGILAGAVIGGIIGYILKAVGLV